MNQKWGPAVPLPANRLLCQHPSGLGVSAAEGALPCLHATTTYHGFRFQIKEQLFPGSRLDCFLSFLLDSKARNVYTARRILKIIFCAETF
jgi:hypothetical protein